MIKTLLILVEIIYFQVTCMIKCMIKVWILNSSFPELYCTDQINLLASKTDVKIVDTNRLQSCWNLQSYHFCSVQNELNVHKKRNSVTSKLNELLTMTAVFFVFWIEKKLKQDSVQSYLRTTREAFTYVVSRNENVLIPFLVERTSVLLVETLLRIKCLIKRITVMHRPKFSDY